MRKKNFYNSNKIGDRGFTILELLVSVLLLSIVIVAITYSFSSDLKNINYAKKQLVATYLAQEGIEFVRNIRDTYSRYDVYAGVDGWNEFKNKFINNCASPYGCYFDIDKDTYSNTYDLFNSTGDMPVTKIYVSPPCPISGCNKMYYHSTTGRYDYLTYSGTLTDYSRKIIVNQIGKDELQIISTVTWEQGSGTKKVIFYDHLFNQIP